MLMSLYEFKAIDPQEKTKNRYKKQNTFYSSVLDILWNSAGKWQPNRYPPDS
jgi:hypothetical protein